MSKQKCSHKSFWQVYKLINFHRNWKNITCPKCGKKISIKYGNYDKLKKNIFLRFFYYLLWISPGILAIALVYMKLLNPIIAILLITAFHFGAMYFIIKSSKLKIKTK